MTDDRTGRFERKDGTIEWLSHGAPHRDDGPAIEHPDGTKEWYWQGKRHREEFLGPAVERPGGVSEWWRYGELHRECGAAIERPDGSCEYWVFGRKNGEITLGQIAAEKDRQQLRQKGEIEKNMKDGTSRDVPSLRPFRVRKPGRP